MTQISSPWRTIVVFHSCTTGIPSLYLLPESPVPPSIRKRTGANKEDDNKIIKTRREKKQKLHLRNTSRYFCALRGRRRSPHRWGGRSRRRPRRHFAPRRPPPAAISRPPAPRAPPDRSAARRPPRPAAWRHGAHLTLWQRPGPWHHPGERPQRLHGTVTVPENASPRLAGPPGMSRDTLRTPTLFGWGRCHPAASTSRRRADATACPEAAPASPRPARATLLPTCGRYGNRPRASRPRPQRAFPPREGRPGGRRAAGLVSTAAILCVGFFSRPAPSLGQEPAPAFVFSEFLLPYFEHFAYHVLPPQMKCDYLVNKNKAVQSKTATGVLGSTERKKGSFFPHSFTKERQTQKLRAPKLPLAPEFSHCTTQKNPNQIK